MPPKKAPQKTGKLDPVWAKPEDLKKPETVGERTQQRVNLSTPYHGKDLNDLTPDELKIYSHTNLIKPISEGKISLSVKAEREYWKFVNKEKLPIRHVRDNYDWGKDKNGKDIASYTIEELNQRKIKQARYRALSLFSRQFVHLRDQAKRQGTELAESEIEEERKRRREMAALKKDLYGELTAKLVQDPVYDDIIPIPMEEPESALARIAYPDFYAEAISYLRAVMVAEEYTPRCLRITEHVISMNPAHYTVWLYRFKIIQVLDLPIPDEIEWLNEVALNNLKNYQIWHHRQLLLDHYYPKIADDDEAVKKLAKSEIDFVNQILAEDTKNYHVWSYRQDIVAKLGIWTVAELGSTQNMIEDDVRNNSAWSHRFYLVFSDPSQSTKDALPTEHDPKVPESVIERELKYTRDKILLSPQNQSSWNYLRGVLRKAGRGMSTEEDFASQFAECLGEEGEKVTSSHALEMLADASVETGNVEKARLCFMRLAKTWDPIREGYWQYRISQLKEQ